MKRLISLAAVTCITLSCAAANAKPYSSRTAPDADSRAVLAHKIRNFKQLHDTAAIHAAFPQLIEQNFAKIDAVSASKVLSGLSELELSHLAQLYTTAVTDTGRTPHLLNILSARLSASEMVRISKHFGYADVDASLRLVAPGKASAFELSASPLSVRPVAGAALSVSTLSISPISGGVQAQGLGEFLDLTPDEIYLTFRTAPVGSLGVTGALYESSVVLGSGVVLAYSVGNGAGVAVNYLLETYDQSLYDAIGGTIATMIESFETSWSEAIIGNWESSLSNLFGQTGQQILDEESGGGDYSVTSDWAADYSDGASGGGNDGSDGGGGDGGSDPVCTSDCDDKDDYQLSVRR